jgi:phosphopantothenoylcysteine decarboxylase/phosphopantothenate--cysteine ligase
MTFQPLLGKEILIAVTGSIAAVETVRLVHALRRAGAGVQAVMSVAAQQIIHPDALTYATGQPTLTRLTGLVEHVTYCGDDRTADLLLIAPCTANTISKIAVGIDDTPVTTCATTALGSGMPVVVVPAMHQSMYRHAAVLANLATLRSWGVDVVPPRIEEGKAKIAGIEEIVLHSERAIGGRSLAGRRVLITSGPCREPVDDVRVLTTRSTGQMGRALALEAFRRGAEVTVVHQDRFPCVRNLYSDTAASMREQVMRVLDEEGADYYLSAAAVSDFQPVRQPGKIPSGTTCRIELAPLGKVIDAVLAHPAGPSVVAFKLGWETGAATSAMLEAGASLVVTNTPDEMGTGSGTFGLVSRDQTRTVSGSKEEVAAAIWSTVP